MTFTRPVAHTVVPLLVAATLAVAAHAATAPASARAASPTLAVKVLSGRADLVAGPDTLVQVVLPTGIRAARVTLNGRSVTSQFAWRRNGAFEGLLYGLRLGRNEVRAVLADGRASELTVTDHPIGGPVFSGPQIQPWLCPAGSKDVKCDQGASYSFSYISVAGGGFRSYDPQNPPPGVATTTTQTGATVPFIVRQEMGYLDRDQYAIAVLYDPKQPWHPWAPQPGYNSKLVLTHGASCDTTYGTGSAPSVLLQDALSRGFIVASHALDNAGHNCNIVTQAESLVMTKEQVEKHYGPVRWTIGSGCSGGSLVQQQVANAYPGLYQGISPQCSFTDAWSSAMQYEDYVMLLKYFQDQTRHDLGDVWTPTAIQQVLDHPNAGNPITFTTAIPNSGNPSRSCPDVPAAQVYNPTTNPHGVKCTLQDYMVNVFGKRRDGFANRPFDNVGIQYGLVGLRKGLLTATQFVDLNSHIGGLDYNGNISSARSSADPLGLQRVYTSGAVDSANNLNQVAIIDLRGPDPGAFHDVYRTYALRARLMRDFGTAANQVLWRGQVPLLGDVNYADQAIVALDTWLARVDADHSSLTLAQKIIQDRPGTVADRCTNGAGVDIPSEECDLVVAAYGTPRIGADMPLADDTLKCQLKPLRKDDYPVTFSAAQWGRLEQTFPTGVCNYNAPGVYQRGSIAWQTYQDASGRVVYGGTPMPPPPVSRVVTSSGP